MLKVDARGDACPLPVVKAKKAIAELNGAGEVEVLVDNEIAVQNLTKMAQQKGYRSAAEKLAEREYRVLFTVGESAAEEEEAPACAPDARTDTVVVIASDKMGEGAEELGKTLLKAFIFSLTQQDKLPKTILLYNGGAHFTCEGSPMLDDLKALEAELLRPDREAGRGRRDEYVRHRREDAERRERGQAVIYLDNAATTLQKPSCVGQAMLDALEHAGNPGRGAHEPTLHAARIVYHARETLATLLHAEGPDCIAFTANVTQALNTALCGLVRPGDHVITTVCEHNSVLRPLYRLREQGAEVSFVEVDDTGRLRYEQFEKFLRPNTRLVVVTHASNVTGDLTDLAFISAFAKKHGLTLVVDAAQTAGARPIDVRALGVDVLCFTGHKALLGPQGTGGLYVRPGLTMAPLVVGGSGIHSFDETHPSQMPTALEAGTLNVPGLAGLGAGVEWILSQGVEALHEKEMALTRLFYEKIVHAPGVKIYGSFDETDRAPIVSLNFGDEDAARAADILWEDYGICVRAGAHCAPLIHKALGTVEQGMVRFSFSHQNTEAEVLRAAEAVCELAEEG